MEEKNEMIPWFTIGMMYLINFFDLVGMVIVYVLFSPLIIDPNSPMVSVTMREPERNLIVGALLAAYPLTQFFGATILGALSDRYGRKKILLGSTLATSLSFFLSAFAIVMHNLPLLFISRLLAGFSAGNITVSQAAVSNLTSGQMRNQCMVAFALIGGIGWTSGALFGTLLLSLGLPPTWNFSLPLWVTGGVLGGAFLLILFFAEDPPFERKAVSIGETFRGLFSLFRTSPVRHPLIASICVMVGWMMYQTFLSTYLIEKYAFSADREGVAYTISSLWWAIGGAFANFWFVKKFAPRQGILLPLWISTAAVFSFWLIHHPSLIWGNISLANASQAISLGCFFALFSQLSHTDEQGRVYGSWNSGFALACCVSPLISGSISGIGIEIPFIIGSLIMLFASLYYWSWYRNLAMQ